MSKELLAVYCAAGHPEIDIQPEFSQGERRQYACRICRLSLTAKVDRWEALSAPVRDAGLNRIPLVVLVRANEHVVT